MRKLYVFIGLALVLLNTQSAEALSCEDHLYSSVTLTANLHCPAVPVALKVMAHNVTINLNGFTLSGNGSLSNLNGISARGFDNLKIRGNGGVIRGFRTGIGVHDGDNSRIDGVVFYNNESSIRIKANHQSVKNSFIYNNDFLFDQFTAVSINNSNRLFESEVTGIVVWNNEFYYSGGGILLCRAKDSMIVDNLIWGSDTDAIQVRKSRSVNVYSNHVYGFQGRGITLDLTSLSEVQGNKVEYGDIGIQVDEATRFVSDTCGSNGISPMSTNALNSITDNSIFNNDTGIVLGKDWSPVFSSADFNLIERNKIYHNHLGILFNQNTKQNVAINNAYTGSTTATVDYGVRNRH